MIEQAKWKWYGSPAHFICWYGSPAHFICADRCRFHLATEIGKHIISTIGEFYRKPDDTEPEEIGCDRKFETFVFEKIAGRCACGCGIPKFEPCVIDSLPANDRATANRNHVKLCRKYAAVK